MKIKTKFTFNELVIILIYVYIACVYMFNADSSKNRYIYLFVIILCLSLAANVQYRKKLAKCNQLFILLALLILAFLSLFWSVNTGTTKSRTQTMLILLLVTWLLYDWNSQVKNPLIFIRAIIIGGTAESIYFIYRYGIDSIYYAIINEERIGMLVNNENAIGNSLAIAMIAIVGFSVYYKKYATLALMIPNLFVFFAANSRTAFVSFLLGMAIIAFFYINMSEKGGLNKLSRAVFLLVCIIVVWSFIREMPVLSGIIHRFEKMISEFTGGSTSDSSAETRLDYIMLGWQQFLKTPMTGNGFGCAGYAILEKYGYITYLHNNFIEMLASTGIIGFGLFYGVYFVNFKRYIHLLKNKNPLVIISFALLCSELFSHVGCVNYYSKITFFLFALWFSVANGNYTVEEWGTENEEESLTYCRK